jgi:hypothetical protein
VKLPIALLVLALSGCGYANLDEGKAVSEKRWEALGFQVVGYEGFSWGIWFGGCYGGANVWSQLKTIPENGIRYTGYIRKWCDDGWQVYGPTAVDAIKP